MKDENYGVELLHSIGRTYQARAAQFQVSFLVSDELTPGFKPICPSRMVPRREEYIQHCL